MKSEYKTQLIKDIVFAVIAWAIGSVIFYSQDFGLSGSAFMGLFIAGIPFGWRWMSNIFTALSIYMIVIKAILALVLGWLALPVVLIKDIIAYKTAE